MGGGGVGKGRYTNTVLSSVEGPALLARNNFAALA